MILRQRHLFLVIILLTTLTTFSLYYKKPIHVRDHEISPVQIADQPSQPIPPSSADSQLQNITKVLVIASQTKDNTDWIDEMLPDWTYVRYLTDESRSKYKVPMNKGNEAMVYLTYIIENYEKLPDLVVFHHSQRFQWHNDDPFWDGAWLLQNMQLPYVLSRSYTNLRCVWAIGCPSDLKGINQPWPTYLDPDDENLQHHLTFQYSVAFPHIFPNTPIPGHVSVPCCAQFAVPASSIRSRSIEEYLVMRKWLLETKLSDDVSGRVFEFAWHLVFQAKPFACEDAGTCYCSLYGICDPEDQRLESGNGDSNTPKNGCDIDRCGDRWDLPPENEFPGGWPPGWPEIGWDGEVRTKQEIEALRKKGKVDMGKKKNGQV